MSITVTQFIGEASNGMQRALTLLKERAEAFKPMYGNVLVQFERTADDLDIPAEKVLGVNLRQAFDELTQYINGELIMPATVDRRIDELHLYLEQLRLMSRTAAKISQPAARSEPAMMPVAPPSANPILPPPVPVQPAQALGKSD